MYKSQTSRVISNLRRFTSIVCSVLLAWCCGACVAAPTGDQDYLDNLASSIQEIQAGSFESASQLLNVALEKRRDEGTAYLVRAIILANCSAWTDADKAFLEAAAMKADPAMCAYGRAVCKLAMRDFGSAEKLLPSSDPRVLQDDLRLFRVYTNFMAGRGLNSTPLNSPIYSQLLAFAMVSEGKRDEAERMLRQVSAPDPGTAVLNHGLAFGFDTNNPVNTTGTTTVANHLLGREAGKPPVTGFSGKVRLKADRAKVPGASYILYYCDKSLIGIVNSNPYEVDWDTAKVANGVHTIKMRGETADGVFAGETSQQ
ncbi:MAG: Ig-like domain-containing protein, partial [Armatimonadota bacterium]